MASCSGRNCFASSGLRGKLQINNFETKGGLPLSSRARRYRAMAPGTTTTLLICSGLIVGIISGMLGIGGGVLIIPALVVLFRFPHERAVGTSLGMLLPPIGIFAFLEYWRHGNVDLTAALLLAAGFAAGAYFGGMTVNARVVHPETLRLLFAFLL